jgi:hypothetical protein
LNYSPSVLMMDNCTVAYTPAAVAKELPGQYRHGGEVGGQLLSDLQGGAVGCLRFRPLAQIAEQNAQVVMARGQVLAVLGHGGEVGGQLLSDLQGGAVGRLRFRPLAQMVQQSAQVVVAGGQVLAVLGHGKVQAI